MNDNNDLNAMIARYKDTGDKALLSGVVDQLQPAIRGFIGTSGIASSPIIEHEARLLTAKAVMSYDPAAGTSLPTWTQQNLRPLLRFRQQKLRPVAAGERLQAEAIHLRGKEAEFTELRKYKPDTFELAEFTGIPIKRIKQIRRGHAVGAEARSVDNFGNDRALHSPIVASTADPYADAIEIILPDLTAVDRRILEAKTGYGGNPTVAHDALSRELKISPATLTRRAARLQMRIQELASAFSEDEDTSQ